MKSLRSLITVIVAASFIFLAAPRPTVSAGDARPPRADVVVGDAENGKTIHAKANQLLEIRLAGNLTTGYAWYAVGGRNDNGKAFGNEEVGVLAPCGEHAYVEDRHAEGMVGVGGTDIYHYTARKPGTQTLRFVQLRPWEDGNVAERRSFKIVVE